MQPAKKKKQPNKACTLAKNAWQAAGTGRIFGLVPSGCQVYGSQFTITNEEVEYVEYR